MISRRENLLIRPWQQKRYENHRRKVQSASAAIDNKPPLPRLHVAVKLKKQQKEVERCKEIERNNFTLLKRLGHLMRTNRVDNFWKSPQPDFLNRVSIYEIPSVQDLSLDDHKEEDLETKAPSTRKLRCSACHPRDSREIHTAPSVPEDRVPWEPPKVSQRRQSLPQVKSKVVRTSKPKSAPPVKIGQPKSAKKVKSTSSELFDRMIDEGGVQPQSIILSRGSLKLSVNFPADARITLQSGKRERMLMPGPCRCGQKIN